MSYHFSSSDTLDAMKNNRKEPYENVKFILIESLIFLFQLKLFSHSFLK